MEVKRKTDKINEFIINFNQVDVLAKYDVISGNFIF